MNFNRLGFIGKFLLLFGVFYGINMLAVAMITEGDWYNATFANSFNYILWITASIMHTANVITQLAGLDTFVFNSSILAVEGGRSLFMNWQCVGLGIFSFWAAFILASEMTLQRKIIWGLSGLFLIWFLNCLRVAILLIALENKWKEWKQSWSFGRQLDHHDIFNYGCYIILLSLIYFFYKKTSAKKKAAQSEKM